jgi:predicted RNA-binding protein (virulence factor B family)
MLQIGKINTLKVLRTVDAGMYLGDEDHNEVLLPNSSIKTKLKSRDMIDVFIYKDSEKRFIASTQIPVAQIYSFAFLQVKSVSDVGAFLDWGLEKDLFVPFSEQRSELEEGQFCVVYIYLDENSERLIGSTKINKFVSNEHLKVEEGEEVDLIVFEESPLGFSCIINGMHRGLMYRNDIYKEINLGDKLKGYIKTIREDNLIDLSLQKSGFKNVLSSTDIILEYLKENDGFLALTDKSSPDEIAKKFSMSKATFKKSIGVLYRQRKVLLKDDGVYLVKTDPSKSDQLAD